MKSTFLILCFLISPVACFAAGHRIHYQDDLHRMGTHFRKLARQVVGPPPGVDWSGAWHEVLHVWHQRLDNLMSRSRVPSWPKLCMKSYWDFCGYVANLPSNRWVCRVLKWNPPGIRSQGRPCHTWESKVVGFCKDQCLGDWTLAARDKEAWANMQDDFIVHCGY